MAALARFPRRIFTPKPAPVSVSEDGEYLIHYFATDCAGTQELYFNENTYGIWNTTFFTIPFNVDTVPPKIVAGPTLSPAPTLINGVLGYCKNQSVHATFTCTDERSGVHWCGPHLYNNPVLNPPLKASQCIPVT